MLNKKSIPLNLIIFVPWALLPTQSISNRHLRFQFCGLNCTYFLFPGAEFLFFLFLSAAAERGRSSTAFSLLTGTILAFHIYLQPRVWQLQIPPLLCTWQMTLLLRRTIQNRLTSAVAKRFREKNTGRRFPGKPSKAHFREQTRVGAGSGLSTHIKRLIQNHRWTKQQCQVQCNWIQSRRLEKSTFCRDRLAAEDTFVSP